MSDTTDKKPALKIHRLSDMVTEEVSVVDRAANGWRFLLVKRAGVEKNHRSYYAMREVSCMAKNIVQAMNLAPDAGPGDVQGLPYQFAHLVKRVQFSLASIGNQDDGPSMAVCPSENEYVNASMIPVAAAIKSAVSQAMTNIAQALDAACKSMRDAEDQAGPEAQVITSAQQSLSQMLASIPVQKADEESKMNPSETPAADTPAPAEGAPVDQAKSEPPSEPPAASPAPSPAPASATPEPATQPSAEPTQKEGRPMQEGRLQRLKAILADIEGAVGDLLTGSLCMDRFKKNASALQQFINELEVSKALAARAGERSTTPTKDSPGASNGVQLDPALQVGAEHVAGPGTHPTLAELLKTVNQLKTDLAKKDEEIASLKSEVTKVRKARSASSVPPSDGLNKPTTAPANKTASWPRDMSAARRAARTTR